MSVRTAAGKTWGTEIPEGTECMYCYRPIKLVAVFWMGGVELWLHAPCAVELMIRLMRDVHEVEIGTHSYVTEGVSAR